MKIELQAPEKVGPYEHHFRLNDGTVALAGLSTPASIIVGETKAV